METNKLHNFSVTSSMNKETQEERISLVFKMIFLKNLFKVIFKVRKERNPGNLHFYPSSIWGSQVITGRIIFNLTKGK